MLLPALRRKNETTGHVARGFLGHRTVHTPLLPVERGADVEIANALRSFGLIKPSLGMKGRNGWRVFTDEGRAVAEGKGLAQVRAAVKEISCCMGRSRAAGNLVNVG
jgi:hypothetical protein